MNVLNLAAERLRRERFIIALAGAIHESLDDASPAFDVIELADEIRRLPDHEIEHYYQAVLSWIATAPGGLIGAYSPALDKHHAEALAWARTVIAATGSYCSLYRGTP